jgi:hypothetical protein
MSDEVLYFDMDLPEVTPFIAKKDQPPTAVQLIREEFRKLMQQPDPCREGNTIGSASAGVYAFFDYDNEPIYVGQTCKSFSDRLGRHITGQRSDAVAKFILDPFEVASIRMWSIPKIAAARDPKDPEKPAGYAHKKTLLYQYEYTVYKMLEDESKFHAVLNEGVIPSCEPVELPPSVEGRIIPEQLWKERKHADVRIARRSATISRLSQMVSEREVSPGMRRTLLLQARRLTWLAEQRLKETGADVPSAEDFDSSDD